MKKKPTKKRVCSCGQPTNDFYCGNCSVAALNKIIAAGGRRVGELAGNTFDNLVRH